MDADEKLMDLEKENTKDAPMTEERTLISKEPGHARF